jgi:hypothetical protein
MEPYLAFTVSYRSHVGTDRAQAERIGEILVRPCFHGLTRVATWVKERDKNHAPKTAAAIAAALLAPDSDGAILDSGRGKQLVAVATIRTERYVPTKPLREADVVIPYDPAYREEVMDAFAALAGALDAVAGFVAVEANWTNAERAVHSKPPRMEDYPDYPTLRRQERFAHFWLDQKIETEIAGPDWAIVLGPGHLARHDPSPSAFAKVREIGDHAKLLQLADDPLDARRPEFDARLSSARDALTPILMDVTHVPIK